MADGKPEENTVDDSSNAQILLKEKDSAQSPSNLVFGYLNLFSDGVVSVCACVIKQSVYLQKNFYVLVLG